MTTRKALAAAAILAALHAAPASASTLGISSVEHAMPGTFVGGMSISAFGAWAPFTTRAAGALEPPAFRADPRVDLEQLAAYRDEDERAVIIAPTDVPEPAATGLLLLALGTLARRLRK